MSLLVSHPFILFSVELLVRNFYADTGQCNTTGSGETWCWKREARKCVRNCCLEVQLLPCWENLPSCCLGIYPFGELWLPGQLHLGIYSSKETRNSEDGKRCSPYHIFFLWVNEDCKRRPVQTWHEVLLCLSLVFSFFFRASCTWREEKLLRDGCST